MDIFRAGTVLLVHAHPDDETLFTGATAAEFVSRGARVVLATASAGEAAEPGDRETAGQRRIAKLERAIGALGVTERLQFGSWIDDAGQGGPGSLTTVGHDELVGEISSVIEQIQPDVIFTVGRDGVTNHPDHIAISRAVAAASNVPVFGAALKAENVEEAQRRIGGTGSDGIRGVSTVDKTITTDAAEAKRRALQEYGINTEPTEHPSSGDLLRVVFEIAGWNVEHFVRLN
jgi:N-acetyl-1-D-myo-inositol-2-amino-2-deoxy-alpha-D-glucopyranoside deacetylase